MQTAFFKRPGLFSYSVKPTEHILEVINKKKKNKYFLVQ